MRSRFLLLLVPVLAVALAGCAKKIDNAKAEKFISKTVAEQVGAEVKSVECPKDLTAKKGEKFTCTVTGADGTKGDTEVTEKDDQGNVRVSAPFIHVDELQTSIANGIEQQSGAKNVEVDCPEIIVGEKGGKFDCDATAGKDKAKVNVTQKDDQGNVTFELQQ